MRKLKDILFGAAVKAVKGSTDVEISKLAFDSRKLGKRILFIAQKGLNFDGHQFIENAVKGGAVAVLCEILPEKMQDDITYVRVDDTHRSLAIVAANFYDNPSEKLKLVGITGTNGKTTIASLLYSLFDKSGVRAGLLSTIKIMVGKLEFAATHTTPDSIMINQFLNEMVLQGVTYCFMEVSSHGIHQSRTAGLKFAGGVFTNLTHDHLDYHGSFAEYRDVKKSFFDELPRTAFALVNVDDKNGTVMLQNTRAEKYTYALKTMADYKARILENQFDGLILNINGYEVYTKLIGNFNAYNLLAIYAVADLLGMNRLEILRLISTLETVEGRFQHIRSKGNITAIVDYAHTPDALKNVLETINAIRTGNEQVITVVGCGGDRDRDKRPKMGNIASVMSDQVVFTSDNPRSEDPDMIIKEIEAGVAPEHYKKVLSVTDRKQAIKTACKMAAQGDIILIAGKGHETYQIIGNKRSDFDDFRTVNDLFKELNK